MASHHWATRAIPFIPIIATAVVLASAQAPSRDAPGGAPQIPQELRERVQRDERVRVIVELGLPSGPHVPEGLFPDAATVFQQRQAIATVGAQILSKLPPGAHRVIHRYQTVPYIVLEVGPAALAALDDAASDIVKVTSDEIVWPVLAQSVPLVQGDQTWAVGYDGSGKIIAVLDSGVDSTHPFLGGKVVEEACYSSTVTGVSQSVCPNGLGQQIGPGSAVPCPMSDCIHGTHVAGIAAGNGARIGQPFSGVAKGAQLMAVQVFSRVTDPVSCGGFPPCAGAFTSDIIAGLERVYAVAGQYSIASVNMSLGGRLFPAPCNGEPYKPIIDNLRSLGIATVVASGNSGSTSGISTPACISSAISVGSTTKTDVVSWFSNVAPFLSLFAPGEAITSSVPGGGYLSLSGTSMAAPHVAGAWALLKQALPSASVTTILNALQQTGLLITDTRPLGTATIPRVKIFEAVATLVPISNPVPVATSLTPTRVRAGSSALTLTINGSGFDAFSVVQWNGVARRTTVVSTQQMQSSIPATDLSVVGTAQVTVFTPAPGGGTSSALIFTIDPPATLTVDASAVAPASPVTVTLANGFGGAVDWLGLAATGAPDNSYLQWTYVGWNVINRTWTVTMPTTPGTYEFRLFVDNARAATSPSVTVDPSLNPIPVASSLAPSRAFTGGPAFTLTVSGSGFATSSVVRWNGANRPTTYVSGTQLQAAIPTTDLTQSGTAQVTVFTPPPGGGTSSSLAFTVMTAPLLTVSATTVTPGGSVTVTLTNGLGGGGDWLALAATTAPNPTYLQYTYVGVGVTTRTWTVTMPATVGTYEFRLFLDNGYTRAATSPVVAVQPGAPVLTSLSPARAIVGSPAFTLTVNGSGFASSSVVRWNDASRPTTYVSGTQLQAAIPTTDLALSGTAQVTVFTPPPGGGTSSSLAFTVSPAPSLTVSATSVLPSSSVTVTLTNGLGGAGDWLALAATTALNGSYLQYTYVGAGVTTRTWTVTMPSTAGTYEFRLFLDNGYTRAATSPAVTVQSGPTPSLTVSATSVPPNSSVTVTLTNGLGGAGDWLALAATTAPDTTYLQYTYVGAGVTTRTWTVTMPSTAGTYEFRLFLNFGYTRLATSAPVTVTP